ncbi:uncharacterized protein DMAD_11787 [Drosophila madeirensis]|uniref:Uncharacterized protein n=1 Tax=Drosophila madeirensis TaxID=30013 RepID=A0AAU9FEE4_DROMD
MEIPKATKRKCDEGAELLRKAVAHVDNISAKKTRDDADIFVEGWAVMYRQMSKEQQLFAKKGIDELLMQGQLNMLTYQGVSSINSYSNASKGRNTSSRSIFPYWDELLSKLPEPVATATEVEITNLLFSKGQPYAQTEQPSDY